VAYAPALALVALLAPSTARAQDAGASSLATRLAGMTAVTGFERAVADTLLQLLPGSTRDRAGNVVLVRGSGAPRRLAACPLDETGFVVGGVRPDGYLTLRRSPAAARAVPALFDQQIEGERVSVWGARGAVPGVVAVRSIHLTRGRTSAPEEPFSLDQAYVDVGAASDSEAAALGVGVLAPVALAKRPHRYGTDRMAAPSAGRRAACAALLSATRRAFAASRAPKGTTVVAFVVEQQLGVRGLLTIASTRGPFAETRVADAASALPPVEGRNLPAGPVAALGEVTRWDMPVAYAGSPVESVSLADVERLSADMAAWLGGGPAR
jgi:putative aminopeptidase FrvX